MKYSSTQLHSHKIYLIQRKYIKINILTCASFLATSSYFLSASSAWVLASFSSSSSLVILSSSCRLYHVIIEKTPVDMPYWIKMINKQKMYKIIYELVKVTKSQHNFKEFNHTSTTMIVFACLQKFLSF